MVQIVWKLSTKLHVFIEESPKSMPKPIGELSYVDLFCFIDLYDFHTVLDLVVKVL